MINDKIRNEFLENGVVLLKQIMELDWILELQKGLEYNFQNPSIYKCDYEKYNGDEVFYDDKLNINLWLYLKEMLAIQ